MPLSTLQETSRDVPSKTRGQDGFATSFPVGLLHPLQHAGLARRSPGCRSSDLNHDLVGDFRFAKVTPLLPSRGLIHAAAARAFDEKIPCIPCGPSFCAPAGWRGCEEVGACGEAGMRHRSPGIDQLAGLLPAAPFCSLLIMGTLPASRNPL